ncbi:MAG: MarR family transcriptional regulator [Clostridiales Family XIII bacterium]|nr:MarR family transcriptional regulator [Clostridiales Family XIII bacterium]
MSEIKTTVAEQLQQLQMLMHRTALHGFAGGRGRNPHRGQGRILALLKIKPEISQRELTYLLNMSKQSLAELLAKLEKSGYVTRKPSEDDKRAVTVALTEEGAAAANGFDDEAPEAAAMLDCLDEDELAAFSGYLARVIKKYEERFPDEDFEERRRMMEAFMSRHGCGFGHRGERFADCRHDRGDGFFGCGHGRHGHMRYCSTD